MKVEIIFKNIKGRWYNFKNVDIKDIEDNSKRVKKGTLFICVKGFERDGHDFYKEAIKKGACCIVTQRRLDVNIPQFVVKDTLDVLHKVALRFYGEPKFKIIGVTGTNGKTTITSLLSHIFERAGYRVGRIGTVDIKIVDTELKSQHTTPPAVELYRIFKKLNEKKAEYVFMEVTSHGLAQRRIEGRLLDVAIFTGVTRDHLDFHKNMENYYKAKKKIFNLLKSNGFGIINIENPYGLRVYKEINIRKKISYGIYLNGLNYRVFMRSISFDNMYLDIHSPDGKYSFYSKLIGKFNAYNICAAFACARELGIESKKIADFIYEYKPVKGRQEKIEDRNKKIKIFIDYAHTPDALLAILETLKSILPSRIIVVFGAGGNRDKEKRPIMGRVAWEFSDVIVLTSDNPRYEEPMDIINDIVKGIPEGDREKVIIEPDRKKAIEIAIDIAEEGDVILIAGKGHEEYQEVKGKKYPLSDRKICFEILKKYDKN
jgi:UDP-N-acetylmuramoyl-L-alanyl-D-glutamate--2,6-diaminopimelate ligase